MTPCCTTSIRSPLNADGRLHASYGFIGVALAWQLVFLLMSRDVRRYRALMLPAVLEKLAFGVPAIVLYAMGRTAGSVAAVGSIDLVLGVLFVLAYRATRGEGSRAS